MKGCSRSCSDYPCITLNAPPARGLNEGLQPELQRLKFVSEWDALESWPQ